MGLSVGAIRELVKANVFSVDEMAIIEMILAAINDWPNPNLTLEDYETEVSEFLGEEPSRINIEKRLKESSTSEFAWQSKSLSKLLEVFKFYEKDVTLRQIFSKLASK
jgi:hypothetical protein